jgi:hypothetical protein
MQAYFFGVEFQYLSLLAHNSVFLYGPKSDERPVLGVGDLVD